MWKESLGEREITVFGFEGLREPLYSSIAQSVEHSAVNRSVAGSSPAWGARSNPTERETERNSWLHGQAVKTSPFHGGNTGSIPVGVIKKLLAKWIKIW